MNIIFFTLAGITALLVVLSLGIGLAAMAKGGSFNEKYGNKMMTARVYLQGLVLLFIALGFLTTPQ